MYENNFENEGDEGWIALGILAFVIICGFLVFWGPDIETIGSWVYTHLQGF